MHNSTQNRMIGSNTIYTICKSFNKTMSKNKPMLCWVDAHCSYASKIFTVMS